MSKFSDINLTPLMGSPYDTSNFLADLRAILDNPVFKDVRAEYVFPGILYTRFYSDVHREMLFTDIARFFNLKYEEVVFMFGYPNEVFEAAPRIGVLSRVRWDFVSDMADRMDIVMNLYKDR